MLRQTGAWFLPCRRSCAPDLGIVSLGGEGQICQRREIGSIIAFVTAAFPGFFGRGWAARPSVARASRWPSSHAPSASPSLAASSVRAPSPKVLGGIEVGPHCRILSYPITEFQPYVVKSQHMHRPRTTTDTKQESKIPALDPNQCSKRQCQFLRKEMQKVS